MNTINFICVCVEHYPMMYARKLISRLKSISNLPFAYYCLTDRPEEIQDIATPLVTNPLSKGWWNKIDLYGPNMPEGWCLYMDVDVVVIKNFDEEILWAISQNRTMACVSDAINWMGVRFNSSFMIFQSGSLHHVYDAYQKQIDQLKNRPGGDQVWAGPFMRDVLYIDDTYPNLKRNLKFHLAKRVWNELVVPSSLDASIKIVDCSGRPKPHELEKLDWVRDNWHSW